VIPGARAAGVIGRHGAVPKVRVRAAPEHGRANDAVVRLLAGALGLPRDRVVVVSGYGRRDKIVELTGITRAESERRLAAAQGKDLR
jgi:uncharacterized protein YggU (UPF0235/DUF167 family)